MTAFKLNPAFHIKGNAKVIREEFKKIRTKNGGQLDAHLILGDARKKKSPLHKYFEWDDGAAAEKYRLSQAGYLIRAVTVEWETDPEEPVSSRAYVHVKTDEKWGYVDIEEALSDDEMYEQVLDSALRYLKTFRVKYDGIKELKRVYDDIDTFEVEVKERVPAVATV